MKANSIRFSPITVALFAVLTTSQRLAALQEVEVTLDQAPQAVKDTILREAGGGKITEIEQETRNGQTTYEAEFLSNGEEVEIKIAADGALLRRTIERKTPKAAPLTLDQIPAAARQALQAAAGGGKITQVEREKSNGAIAYEAAWTVNGATHEAAVLEDGTLLNTEETMTVDKAPAAIQAAVAKHFPGSTKVAVEKLTIVAYEAEGKAWIASGAALNGLAAEIGAQTGQTISLGRAPAGVQAAVARQFPGNPKVDLKKKTLVLYELAGRANGKPAEMLVTSSGNRIEQGDDGESEDDDDEGEDDDDEDDDEDEDDDDGEDDDENGEDD